MAVAVTGGERGHRLRRRMETIREQSESSDKLHLLVTAGGGGGKGFLDTEGEEDTSSGRGSVNGDVMATEEEERDDEYESRRDSAREEEDKEGEQEMFRIDCCSSCNSQIRFIEMKGL